MTAADEVGARVIVVSCDGEPHRVVVDGGSLRVLDHPDGVERGVCPGAGAAWARGVWPDELPEPLRPAAEARWAAVGVFRYDLEMVRETVGDGTPEEVATMVAGLGDPSRTPWWSLLEWARVLGRSLTESDFAALVALKGRMRPGDAAEWQAACGRLPGVEELARFAELEVETGRDAWLWALALGGATIDPATVEHVRSMGFRNSGDLQGWRELFGVRPGVLPGVEVLEAIEGLRGVGVRRPRHAALWAKRLGRLPTAADVRGAPLARLYLQARLLGEIATAGGPFLPFDEEPQLLLFILALGGLVETVAFWALQTFTHQAITWTVGEAMVIGFAVLVLTQVPTPYLEHGYGHVPWESPASDAQAGG